MTDTKKKMKTRVESFNIYEFCGDIDKIIKLFNDLKEKYGDDTIIDFDSKDGCYECSQVDTLVVYYKSIETDKESKSRIYKATKERECKKRAKIKIPIIVFFDILTSISILTYS